jgi:hypothetical protein
MYDRIRRVFTKNNEQIGFTQLDTAYIGRGDGSDPRNLDGPYPRMIWFWNGTEDNRKIGTAILSTDQINYDKVQLTELARQNIEIQLSKPPGSTETDPYEVTKITKRGLNSLGGITPAEQKQNAQSVPNPANLTGLRVEVTGSNEVYINPSTYTCPTDGLLYRFGGGLTGFAGADSIAALISSLISGQHQVAWVCLDYVTGLQKAVASTAVSAVGTLPQRTQLFSTVSTIAVTASYKRIVPVYLYYGQTEITADDVLRQFDARLDFPLPTGVDYAATVSTSNNTATIIASILIAELSSVVVTGEVVGTKTDYSASLGATFSGAFRRASGGNVTLVGTAHVTTDEDSSNSPAVTLVATTGTQTADIKVTGVTGENWDWRATYRITTK